MCQLRKSLILIVLTNSKIYIVSTHYINKPLANFQNKLVFAQIQIWIVLINRFIFEWIPNLQKFSNIFACFFKNNQSIDTPRIKPQPIIPILYGFNPAFKTHMNN